jgi:hypothetical protein
MESFQLSQYIWGYPLTPTPFFSKSTLSFELQVVSRTRRCLKHIYMPLRPSYKRIQIKMNGKYSILSKLMTPRIHLHPQPPNPISKEKLQS